MIVLEKICDATKSDEDKDLEQKLFYALPKRFEPKDLGVESLSSLFQFKFQYPGRFNGFYEKVQDLLLDFTVHEAYNQSEFYQHLYPELAEHDFIDKEKLKDFPLIFRHQVEEAGKKVCSKSVDYGFTSYTEGTTSNNPLIIDRSIQEERYIYNFFLKLDQKTQNSKSAHKLVLSLTVPDHGNVLRIPAKNVSMFPVPIIGESNLTLAVKLLERSFTINGEENVISCIAGTGESISKLTAFILHKGIDIKKNITQIQTGGSYLPTHVSDWLRDFWNCDIIDNFSFAELFLSAAKCLKCGFYHFNPYGIAEVLDIHSNQRIDSGRGRLFVTGLYPFTQMTPLIRYSTGDLVEIKKVNCIQGQYGYLCLGRQKNSLIFKKEFSDYGFLSGGEVYDVLDGIADVKVPDVKIFPSYCESIGYKPVFWFENDPLNIIHIELRYSPVFYPQRLEELRNIIKARLISKCNWLEGMFEKQLISLEFHPPGSHSKEDVFRP
jgi:phenylacetate-coenzyme A ligase PaaK-like adenylate-forming protein